MICILHVLKGDIFHQSINLSFDNLTTWTMNIETTNKYFFSKNVIKKLKK